MNTVIMFLWCYTWVDVICIWGVVIFLFLLMPLLSSWDDMDVCVKLLADDLWAAEDDKPGFLSVGVDSFDWLFLYKRPMPLPMVMNSNKNRKYDKWG